MKESEFKHKLLMNHELTWIHHDLLSYSIEVDSDVDVKVRYSYVDGKLLPCIFVMEYITGKEYIYQSFKKALNRIEKILEE